MKITPTPPAPGDTKPLDTFLAGFKSAPSRDVASATLRQPRPLNDVCMPRHMHVEQHVKAGFRVSGDGAKRQFVAPGGWAMTEKALGRVAMDYAVFVQGGNKR